MLKTKSKALAALIGAMLAMTMLVALPATAYADDTDYVIGGTDPGGGALWAEDITSLLATYGPLGDGDTITLLYDVDDSATDDWTWTIDYGLTIDLDGYDLVLHNAAGAATIEVTTGGSLEVYDGGSLAAGSMSVLGSFEFTAYNLAFIAGGFAANGADAEATVNANLTTAGITGVRAENGAIVTVNGNITANGTDSFGVYASTGATVTVNGGSITAGYEGVCATGDGTTVTVTADIAANHGVEAASGAYVEIVGDIYSSGDGLSVRGSGTKVYMTGDISVDLDSTGVYAIDGAYVEYTGNITAVATYGLGVGVYDEDTEVYITGDIDASWGAEAWDGAYLVIDGNIKATEAGAIAGTGNGEEPGGFVVVYGTIDIAAGGDYVRLYYANSSSAYDPRDIGDDDGTWDDEVYYQRYTVYTDDVNFVLVWLSAYEPQLPPLPPTTPATGDVATILIAAALLAAATGLTLIRRRKAESN